MLTVLTNFPMTCEQFAEKLGSRQDILKKHTHLKNTMILFVSQNCCTLFYYKLCVVFVVQLSNIKKLQITFKIETHVISVLFVNSVN
jgi:L-cystine uptake protein TcyP (sodium:dicarboxylate symporter family)